MKTIGLVDDKESQREAFKLKLALRLETLNPDWEVTDTSPFKDMQEYISWISENEISVLIIDERLNEGMLADGTHVGYYGSELVKELRLAYSDIPIFCITSYEITKELKESVKHFNLTLNRANFDLDMDNYLNLFIRSGQSFYKEFQLELEKISEISKKIALGIENQNDVDELKGLQARVNIPFSNILVNREVWLKEYEAKIKELTDISNEVNKKISEINDELEY